MKRTLWETSGHWDHYKDNMYTTVIDGEDFAIKPMNCPGSILVYELEPHSYRDLPLRYGELGLVHRHELSGALHGMFRVRCFTQDDAHTGRSAHGSYVSCRSRYVPLRQREILPAADPAP